MEDFTIKDIIKATDGRLIKGNPDTIVSDISTDSRTLNEGDLFVALIGERFDGHSFIKQAIERGAIGVVVSKDVNQNIGCVIRVSDTLQALGDIAKFYRERFHVPVIGVTGSNGKTTTKDMIASVLQEKYNVLKSEGNLNNTIGLPLTVFKLSKTHETLVLEMGISVPGEMARLVEIAKPKISVITNISPTHLEFLGSIEGVIAEKSILARSTDIGVLNADDPNVANMRNGIGGKTIFYSVKESADVMAVDIEMDQYGRPKFRLILKTDVEGEVDINIPSIGKHNVYNALRAASVGSIFGVEIDLIKKALEMYKPMEMRMQRLEIKGITIIDDTYNSNPASLIAAIDFLLSMDSSKKKALVVGDMLELGEHSDRLHAEIGDYIGRNTKKALSALITVGGKSVNIAESAIESGFDEDKVIICKTNSDAASQLFSMLDRIDVVLIKGSRGMRMEEIVNYIKEKMKGD
ncbi:MAG: UDP-N-acetylmuramoyl-tripeptide--D-alanyl-D-alanine ligase [bacterium]